MATPRWPRLWPLIAILAIFGLNGGVESFPDPGFFSIHMNSSRIYNGVVKNMYNGTKIFIKVRCEPKKGMNYTTVWSFENFSVSQILREINIGESEIVVKSAVFASFGILNIVNLANSSLQKV